MPEHGDIHRVAGEIHRLAGELKTYFEMWRENHLEYKGDIADCLERFNNLDRQNIRTNEYLQRIADAQTEAAIRANRFEQIVANLADDVAEHRSTIKKLDERVTKIETQHAKEHGRNQLVFALWSMFVGAIGAVFGAVIAPWALSHWFKTGS